MLTAHITSGRATLSETHGSPGQTHGTKTPDVCLSMAQMGAVWILDTGNRVKYSISLMVRFMCQFVIYVLYYILYVVFQKRLHFLKKIKRDLG